jgi:hypothetical protein
MDDPQFLICDVEFYSLTNLWHNCIEHFNHHTIWFLGKQQLECGELFLLESKFICPSCMEGKKSCECIIKIAKHRVTSPLALVHTNLCGMIHLASLGGAHYFISFTNDFSCFTWLYFLEAFLKHYKHSKTFVPKWGFNLFPLNCCFYATIMWENMPQEIFSPFALKQVSPMS